VPDKGQIEVLEQTRNVAEEVTRARVGTELWKLFVILAILCALAEMVVAKTSAREVQPA